MFINEVNPTKPSLDFVPVHDARSVYDKLATFPDEDTIMGCSRTSFPHTLKAGRQVVEIPSSQYEYGIIMMQLLERSPKTTNCCEGFHNALNSLFHCSHPSVWILFDGLQRDPD
jgi:hypothetical protein